jgi:hypothetical protein
MDSYLTLVGSIVIGGIFLLGLLSFHGDIIDQSYDKTFELLTQETTAGLMEIIDHDFTRMGSGAYSPAFAITLFDTSRIIFNADLDEDGDAEVVEYRLSNASAAASTENPNDRILYRIVDGDSTINTPFGVRRFRMNMYRRQNITTTDMREINMIEIILRLESTFAYDGEYAIALWEKRITPQGLVRVPRS